MRTAGIIRIIIGLVIGVDRGAGAQTLTDAGAHLVVADLGELA